MSEGIAIIAFLVLFIGAARYIFGKEMFWAIMLSNFRNLEHEQPAKVEQKEREG
jgi:hypothetical protein